MAELLIENKLVYAASRDLAYLWNPVFRKALAILSDTKHPSPVDQLSDRHETRKQAMDVVAAAAKAVELGTLPANRGDPVTQILLKAGLFQFDPIAVAAALTAIGQAFVGTCVAASKAAAFEQSIQAFSDLSGITSQTGPNVNEQSKPEES